MTQAAFNVLRPIANPHAEESLEYLDLILNLSLLIALCVVSGFVDRRWPRETWLGAGLQGFLFGMVVIIGMLRPLVLGPGLIFDGRTVMLSLCALFFGPRAITFACAMALVCRFSIGGTGLVMGLTTILSSSIIGLAAHYLLKPTDKTPSASRLYGMGLIVHAAMVALMFTLPGDAAWSTFKRLALPVMLLYPLATILAGTILSDHLAASRAETVLQQERQRLQNIIEGTNAGTWEWNIQTGEVTFNKRWAEMIGYTLEELSPVSIDTWKQLTHPDDLTKSEDCLARHFAGELSYYDCELRMKHKDGRWIWMLDRGKVSSWTKDGQPLWMQGTHVEINERKQAEAQLEQEKNLYKDLVASQPAGVYRLRILSQKPWRENEWLQKVQDNYRLELVNDRFCELLRATPQECRANASIVVERIHPDDRADFIAKNVKALETLSRFEWEGRLSDQAGAEWVYFASVPRIFPDGDVVWTGILVDISESRQAQEALEKSEELFRNLFHRHAAAKLLLNPHTGQIIDANEAAVHFYGWSRETLKQMNISDINTLPPEDVKNQMEAARLLQRNHFEFKHRRATGDVRDVEVFSSKITVKGQDMLHSIINDITDRKVAEENVRKLNDELEQQVAKRTEELKRTIAELEELNRVFVGRELKMAELKKRIEELESQKA